MTLPPLYTLACLACLLGICLFWHATQTRLALELPPVAVVERITVTRPDGTQGTAMVTLGRADLGQTDTIGTAEIAHLGIRFAGARPDALINLAQDRRLSMTYASGKEFSDRDIVLRQDDIFRLGDQSFTVTLATADRIVLEGSDGRRHALPQVFDPADTGLWAGWESEAILFGGLVDHDPSRLPPPGLSGLLQTGRAPYWAIRVAVPGVEDAALHLSRQGKDWRLRVLARSFVQICRGGFDCRDPSRQAWPLVSATDGPLTELVVGRTVYDVAFDAGSVVLEPRGRAHWLSEDRMIRPEDVGPGVVQATSPPFLRGIGTRADVPEGFLAATAAALGPFLSWAGLAVLATGVLAMVASARPAHPGGLLRSLALALFCLAAYPTLQAKVPDLPGTFLAGIGGLSWLEGIFADPRRLFFVLAGMSAWAGLFWRAFRPASWRAPPTGVGLRRSFPRRLAARVAILALCTFGLWMLRGTGLPQGASSAVFTDGLQPQAMTFALILLYLLVGTLLAVTAWASAAPFLWLVVTAIVAFGTLNGFLMVFGHRLPMHRELFDMHVAAMAVLALVCAHLAAADRRAMAAFLQRRVRRLQSAPSGGLRGWHGAGSGSPAARAKAAILFLPLGLWSGLRLVWVRRGHLAILLVSLVLAYALFTTSEAGVFGVFQPSELGKTWIALLVALTLAALHEKEIWRMPYEARLSALWPAVFLGVVFVSFALGSAINSDLSPILILAAMAGASGFVLLLVNVVQRFSLGWFLVAVLLVLLVMTILGTIRHEVAATLLVVAMAVWLSIDRQRETVILTSTRTYRAPWARRMRGKLDFREWLQERLDRAGQNLVAMARLVFGAVLAAGALLVLALPDLKSPASAFTDPARLEIYDAPMPATVQDRFLSWIDGSIFRTGREAAPLVRHPDLLLQVRESREVIAASGCRLADLVRDHAAGLPSPLADGLSKAIGRAADRVAGLAGLCQSEGALPRTGELPRYVMAVPAIQDDFAGTFFVAAFGTDGMLALILVQATLVLVIWGVAGASISFGLQHRPMRSVSMLGAVFLFNAGFILLAQFAMAWSNILGLLPVVGQPMTFLSFAGSHHLFVAVPAVAATLAFALISGSHRTAPPRLMFPGYDIHRHQPAI